MKKVLEFQNVKYRVSSQEPMRIPENVALADLKVNDVVELKTTVGEQVWEFQEAISLHLKSHMRH